MGTSYNQLLLKLNRKKKGLEELQNGTNGENAEEIKMKLIEQIRKKNKLRMDALQQIHDETNKEYKIEQSVMMHQMTKKFNDKMAEHIMSKIRNIQKKNQDLRKALAQSEKEEVVLQRQAQTLRKQVSEKYPFSKYGKMWSVEDKKMSLEEIMDKINHLQGRINVLLIDKERVRRYERLNGKIKKQKEK